MLVSISQLPFTGRWADYGSSRTPCHPHALDWWFALRVFLFLMPLHLLLRVLGEHFSNVLFHWQQRLKDNGPDHVHFHVTEVSSIDETLYQLALNSK